MSGTVNISRDLWDDPTFKDSEMSQREAWIWLVANASWKDRVRNNGTREVYLKRGQLTHSTRFLAKAWQWSEPRVRRYLGMLENRRMIERVTDAGQLVITICNYDKYQNKPRVCDAASTHQPTQHRRTTDANHNKGEIRGKEGGGGGAPEREADQPPQDFDEPEPSKTDTYRERLLSACGADPVSGMVGPSGQRLGTESQMIEARRWLEELGLTESQVTAEISRIVHGKRDGPPGTLGYFTRPMERLAGEINQARSRPMRPDNVKNFPGSRNDRSEQRHREDQATDEYIRRRAAGEIDLGPDPSDPFAGK